MNENIKSIFVSYNNYNTLVIEKPQMGNFVANVGNNDTSYTQVWGTNENENFKWVENDDGNEIYCVCINNNEDQINLELKAKFLYDSDISFRCIPINPDITWKVCILDENNKKIREKIDEDISTNIKKNNTISFNIQISECKENTTIFMISDLKCLTNENTTIRIPVKSMLSFISTTVKSEIKNALLTTK
jgi:hypothetical protein